MSPDCIERYVFDSADVVQNVAEGECELFAFDTHCMSAVCLLEPSV